MGYKFDAPTRERLRANVTAHNPTEVAEPTLRRAAVALAVLPHPETGAPAVLLTLRGGRLRRHRGQYAIPGGRLDPGETAMTAALRELREEVGMTLDPAQALGRLDDLPTLSGFRITPFVFWSDAPGRLIPDPGEVEAIFHIPLDELAAAELEARAPAPGEPTSPSLPLPTVGEEIYVPTAAILWQFREVALFGRTTRVDGLAAPRFAHR